MRFTAEGDYITGIAPDGVYGYIVSMTRTPVTRYYWYSTIPQALRAARWFRAHGKWPRKKNIRKSLHSVPQHGIIPK